MKKQIAFGVLVLGLVIGLAVVPAHAQDNKFQLFGGYSYATTNYGQCEFDGCDPGTHGYALSAAYNLNKNIALEAAFTGHNGSNIINSCCSNTTPDVERLGEDIYTFTFGPKFMLPVGHFTLYSHVLVGGNHSHLTESCTGAGGEDECGTAATGESAKGGGFSVKTGAGVDWNHGRWGVRVLEVNYIHNETGFQFNDENDYFHTTSNTVELATGLTFNFGKP